jgi:hypothetical protein
MKTIYIFPVILMSLNVGASIVYFCKCDWKMGLYWLFAMGLTAIVTFK